MIWWSMSLAAVFVLVAVAACCAATTTAPSTGPSRFGEFDPPPLVLPDRRQVAAVKRRVTDDPAAAAAFRREVFAVADGAVDAEPRPFAAIVYAGRVSNDPDRLRTIDHLRDLPKITALTWAAVVTGDDRYARAAARWATAWARTCRPTGNDVNDNKLDAILLAVHLLGDRMSVEQRDACLTWARTLGARHASAEDKLDGNRLAKRIKLIAAAGVVTGDAGLVTDAAARFQRYVASELRPDGRSTDLEQRDALAYHVSGLTNILEAALLLRAGGHDLYARESPAGASVRRSVAWVGPYAKGEQVHAEWVNTTVELDRKRWAAGDETYRPGRPWEPATSLAMYQLAAAIDPEQQGVLDVVRRAAAQTVTWADVILTVDRN